MVRRSHTYITCLVALCASVSFTVLVLFAGIAAACTGTGGAGCAQKPLVTTGGASSITYDSALLNGTVNPEGCETTYTFEYGLSAAFYAGQVRGPAGNGIFSGSVSGRAVFLEPSTTYHYRLSATNSAGTAYGTDRTFTTAPKPPPPTKYAALGDSYSSGLGTETFYATDNYCKRTNYSYPALLAKAHPEWISTNLACQNETTRGMINTQIPKIATDTKWITYTIGGNDVGFESVMKTCGISTFSECKLAVDLAQYKITHELPGKLNEVNAAIKARAANAKVIVLNYPRLYSDKVCLSIFNLTQQEWFNQSSDLLREQIDAATTRAGANFIFINVISKFTGHAICDGSGLEWINGLSLNPINSYHPNIKGHAEGYYPLVKGVTG